jgi:hypothetical protein
MTSGKAENPTSFATSHPVTFGPVHLPENKAQHPKRQPSTKEIKLHKWSTLATGYLLASMIISRQNRKPSASNITKNNLITTTTTTKPGYLSH